MRPSSTIGPILNRVHLLVYSDTGLKTLHVDRDIHTLRGEFAAYPTE